MPGDAQAVGSDTVELTTIVAHQWQCDHFGHLNARHYAAIFDDAIFVFWNWHGSARGDGIVPVTAETRTAFRSEIPPGTIASVRSRVGRIGSKSVTVHLELADAHGGNVFATCDVVEVFFNLETRVSEPIPTAIRDRLTSNP